MNTLGIFAPIVIGLALLAVVGILLFGVVSMAIGGKFDQKWSNKLMRLRVIAQAVAILLLAVLWLILKN
ncbi:MAG: twin transmembrane helix small protein [Candidatus Eiseniibacteriota bacterium]